jgi:hypothetical protein
MRKPALTATRAAPIKRQFTANVKSRFVGPLSAQYVRMQAGQVSPDGMWRWDGERWALAAPASLSLPDHASIAARRPVLGVAGAAAAMLGATAVLAGCFLPFVYWNDTSNGATSSVFDPGYGGGLWYALEPVGVAVLALVAAALVAALRGRIRTIAAGALVAIGLQTAALFVGYCFATLGDGRIGPGGPVGVVGGLLILAGGALAIVQAYARDDA